MLIGKVIGDIVATRKHPSHEGQKMLYVQILNLDGSERGNPVLAVDAADAGRAPARRRRSGPNGRSCPGRDVLRRHDEDRGRHAVSVAHD